MRRMILLAGLLLAGCGGGGGSSLPSPFAGAWQGEAVLAGSASNPEAAAVTLSVDSKGRITGAWVDSVSSGAVSGQVERGGQASVSFTEPGPPPLTVTGQGVTNIAQDGAWKGSLPVVATPGMSLVFQVARQ